MMNTLTGNELFEMFLHVVMAYGQICVLCFYGQYLTDSYEKLSNVIFACEWYRFPSGSKKSVKLMLSAAQYPVEIQGFGSTSCTRQSLKEVRSIYKFIHLIESNYEENCDSNSAFQMINLTFSYFMMLRQL